VLELKSKGKKMEKWGAKPHPKNLQINFIMLIPRSKVFSKRKNYATLVKTPLASNQCFILILPLVWAKTFNFE
jgi:hypothetical protein